MSTEHIANTKAPLPCLAVYEIGLNMYLFRYQILKLLCPALQCSVWDRPLYVLVQISKLLCPALQCSVWDRPLYVLVQMSNGVNRRERINHNLPSFLFCFTSTIEMMTLNIFFWYSKGLSCPSFRRYSSNITPY